jgi:hypothetical protein
MPSSTARVVVHEAMRRNPRGVNDRGGFRTTLSIEGSLHDRTFHPLALPADRGAPGLVAVGGDERVARCEGSRTSSWRTSRSPHECKRRAPKARPHAFNERFSPRPLIAAH